MMSLFDEEEIMRTYWEDLKNETKRKTEKKTKRKTEREVAERMIRDGEMSLEKIAHYVPSLSLEELKELEAKIMQLA